MDGKHVSMLALRGQYGLSSIALAVTVVTSRFVLKNPPEAVQNRRTKMAASENVTSKLPSHLAHPLKDNHTVAIHAFGSSLQRSRQDCSEPCRLLPADTPG